MIIKFFRWIFEKRNYFIVKFKEPISFDELRDKMINGLRPGDNINVSSNFIYFDGQYFRYIHSAEIFISLTSISFESMKNTLVVK